MSAIHNGSYASDDAACWSVPSEFVRLRYFFGQRLGAVDLFDEQLYHASKQRFHNQRAHGTGVLCGLRVERFAAVGGGASTTMLRVHRGAAIDACGREIVVGWDQCIDLAAWFAKNRARPDVAAVLGKWGAGDQLHEHPLYVALRYRECPSDPSPAPRDPCGCDEGGCEFGRVREGFELAILTKAEVTKCVAPLFPDPGGKPLLPEQQHDMPLDGFFRRLGATLVASDCPEPPSDPWLCLARLDVAVTGNPNATTPTATITDILSVDVSDRASLLDTAFLQQIAFTLLGAAGEAGMIGDGPHLGGLGFQADGGADAVTKGTLRLRVDLAPGGAGLMGNADFDAAPYFKLQKLDRTATPMKWSAVGPDSTKYVVAAGGFQIHFNSGQGAGTSALYRLSFESPWDAPLVDMKSRPLRPMRWARQFLLDNSGGTLTLKNVT